MTKTEGTRN